jgi:hypothetical protein
MLATTHPASALRGTPLFGFAGKRGKKLILNFQLPLSNEVEERDVGRSLDRVSRCLGWFTSFLVQTPNGFYIPQ